MKKFGKVLIGCFVIFIILAILGAIFGGIIIRRIISGAIKEKTGVSIDVNNTNPGKLSYTDPKTGATLNIGENKIPDNFPKDFPIYPNSSVTSSLAGSQNNTQGVWLTLNSKDNTTKVDAFYQDQLKANGWTVQVAAGESGAISYSISKDKLKGILTLTKSADNANETTILIILGQQ